MYQIEVFRFNIYTPQVQVDTFTTSHYELAVNVFEYIWDRRETMKHDHNRVELRFLDDCGHVIQSRLWECKRKGGTATCT